MKAALMATHYLDVVNDIAAQRKTLSLSPICNKLEAEIAELADEERIEFLQELGMDEPGLDRVIRAGYELLRAANLLHRRANRRCAPGP